MCRFNSATLSLHEPQEVNRINCGLAKSITCTTEKEKQNKAELDHNKAGGKAHLVKKAHPCRGGQDGRSVTSNLKNSNVNKSIISKKIRVSIH